MAIVLRIRNFVEVNRMLVADRFKQIFGVYATEIWALPESDFLNWLNSEAPELKIGIREMTNSEILEKIYGRKKDDN